MNEKMWIQFAKDNQQKLEYLINRYHPASCLDERNYQSKRLDDRLGITASNAELASKRVRNDIRQNFEGEPTTQFTQALENNDIATVYKILNETWFGVPESSLCWQVNGFKEAVILLEELPD